MVRAILASSENRNRTFTATPSYTKTPYAYPTNTDQSNLLTPDEVVAILQEIVELRGLKIFYEETSGDKIAFYVGEGIYTIHKDEETE